MKAMESTVKKIDIKHARRFANVFWFIDDLTVFNDERKSEKSCKEIYHPKICVEKGKYRKPKFYI